MHSEPSFLLSQTPLSVSPYITLPVPPTLPHNYTTLPSTLPASILSAPGGDPTAYVLSATGHSAHPSGIKAQNAALLGQLGAAPGEARGKVERWEAEIRDRELRDKRRRAPGWLDSEEKILRPETGEGHRQQMMMGSGEGRPAVEDKGKGKDEVGELMDRAFG